MMFKGWKTLVFGAAVAALGFLQQADWVNVVGDQWGGLVVGAIGIVVMVLRTVTNSPAGKTKQ